MSVVANVNADPTDGRVKARIAQVARAKVEFLPKSRIDVRDMRLAIRAEELAVGIERGWSPREALVLGAACGTAGATYLLPELPPGFDPDAWTPRIRLESLEPET